jgi:hydrogenase accessory protein HypB
VCPASYDMGESVRLVLMSEGENKLLKYPTIFNMADVAIITKADLKNAVEFDSAAAERNVQAVEPGMPVFHISAKNGEGMAAYIQFWNSNCGGPEPPRLPRRRGPEPPRLPRRRGLEAWLQTDGANRCTC